MAGPRQVKDAKIALQHNIGLGGAVVVGLYKKYNNKKGWDREDQSADPDVLEKVDFEGINKKLSLILKFEKGAVSAAPRNDDAEVVSSSIKMLKSYNLLDQAKNYCSRVGHVYNFIIRTSNQGKLVYLTLDLKTGIWLNLEKELTFFSDPGSLKEGVNKSPDAVILVQDDDFADLADGKLTVQSALQKQKMRLKGKTGAVTFFTTALLGSKPKL